MGFMSALGGAALNIGTSMFNRSQDWRYDKKAMKYQNEYNSPVNQMERLRQAGLNPNLVYGTGSTGITGNMSSVSRSKGQGADPLGAMSKYYTMKNQNLQSDILKRTSKNLEAQNDKLYAEIENIKNQTEGVKEDVKSKARDNRVLQTGKQSEMSSKDPFYARAGSRIYNVAKEKLTPDYKKKGKKNIPNALNKLKKTNYKKWKNMSVWQRIKYEYNN